MGFLPKDYKEPKKTRQYVKPSDLAEGSYKFRVLSEPVMGWTYWTEEEDGKRVPNRVKDFKEVPAEYRSPEDDKDRAYYWWAMLVWNYQDEAPQIMEVKQATIRNRIQELDQDADWGDVRNYDIKITNTGKTKGDKYTVATGAGKTKFDTKGKEIPHVNLEALFTGEDPFNTLAPGDLSDLDAALDADPGSPNSES